MKGAGIDILWSILRYSLKVLNHLATKIQLLLVNSKPNVHTWSQFGYFDRALCPVKFNYGQTVANLSRNCPLSIVHCLDGYHEHWCVYVCLHVCVYVYLLSFCTQVSKPTSCKSSL